MSASQAGNYFGKDDYYLQESGTWFGKTAEELGLSGEIDRDSFLLLAAGKHPETGEDLVKGGGKSHDHRSGNDMTFSAPKSVSILALADERIQEAHNAAVEKALSHFQAEYAQIRQTANGITERVETGNIVAGIFNHMTSRELDPQLHSHAFIMNMSQNEKGDFRALENKSMFTNKMYLGTIYHSELAKSLNELGYRTDVIDTKTGNFEIAGVSKELQQDFSKRSQQINDRFAEVKDKKEYEGMKESEIKAILTLETRKSKPKEIDKQYLKDEWQKVFIENQTTPELERERALEAGKNNDKERLTAIDYVNKAAEALSKMESTATVKDLVSTAARIGIGDVNTDEIRTAISDLTAEKEIISLTNDKGDKKIITTLEMQRTEKQIIDNIRAGVKNVTPLMSQEKAVETAAKYETLSDNQREFVEKVLSSDSQFLIVQGYSGAGKTFAAAKVTDEAKELGFAIRALGPTAAAARELGNSTGVVGQTLSRFFKQSDEKLDFQQGKEIWLVDEASMIESRQMLELVERAAEKEARVILIGDRNQLQSVGAGKIFDDLQRLGVGEKLELTDIKRQKTEHMFEVAGLIRDIEKVREAINIIDERGEIKEIKDFAERVQTITDDYTSSDPNKTMLIVSTNAERHALNASIHDKLYSEGKLGAEEFTIAIKESVNLDAVDRHYAQSYKINDIIVPQTDDNGMKAGSEWRIAGHTDRNTLILEKDGEQREFDIINNANDISIFRERDINVSIGDKMVFLKNDLNTVGVVNGDSGIITHIDKNGWIKIQTEGGEKSFNLAQYNHVDLGHAITSYKAQGASIKRVIGSIDHNHENYNDLYVVITRGIEDATLYTNDKEKTIEAASEYQEKSTTLDYPENEKKELKEMSLEELKEEFLRELAATAIAAKQELEQEFTPEQEQEKDKEEPVQEKEQEQEHELSL